MDYSYVHCRKCGENLSNMQYNDLRKAHEIYNWQFDDELKKERQKIKDALEDESAVEEIVTDFPEYDFVGSIDCKRELEIVANKQKTAIKDGRAIEGRFWYPADKRLANMMLIAFNKECDDIISKAKFSAYSKSLSKITSTRDSISKKGGELSISEEYYRLKLDELALVIKYRQEQHNEDEDRRARLEQTKEDAKVQKEIENERVKLEKQQNHLELELRRINQRLSVAKEDETANLADKKKQIEDSLTETERKMSDLDFREANQRAGYVYVISNIGSFGENVFKIGVTRRLEPQDRVNELGTASVPFKFDVHAMIFSTDAFKLESALHKAFDDRKVNMLNKRKEFFNVSLDEIKSVILENFDKTVEFIDTPDAEQYWGSKSIRERSSAVDG